MRNFAFYRLPDEETYTETEQLHGEPEELHDICELNGKDGFVLAPFKVSYEYPILLIHKDREAIHKVRTTSYRAPDFRREDVEAERKSYSAAFSTFHRKLAEGSFDKIVLSRMTVISLASPIELEELFLKTCNMYPSMFVALVSTTRSGIWLMATPEILLKGNERCWSTMALAGTMKKGEGRWSDKNRREQKCVADYIRDCLHDFSKDVRVTAPYTSGAADLVHLRSDFTFVPDNPDRVGDLLGELHPTPAVCGLPKYEAQKFIEGNEACSRKYYSGFAGAMSPEMETNLYVSLRCMRIDGNKCELYAGGGLLKESEEHLEWEETEAKMQTMLRLFSKEL